MRGSVLLLGFAAVLLLVIPAAAMEKTSKVKQVDIAAQNYAVLDLSGTNTGNLGVHQVVLDDANHAAYSTSSGSGLDEETGDPIPDEFSSFTWADGTSHFVQSLPMHFSEPQGSGTRYFDVLNPWELSWNYYHNIWVTIDGKLCGKAYEGYYDGTGNSETSVSFMTSNGTIYGHELSSPAPPYGGLSSDPSETWTGDYGSSLDLVNVHLSGAYVGLDWGSRWADGACGYKSSTELQQLRQQFPNQSLYTYSWGYSLTSSGTTTVFDATLTPNLASGVHLAPSGFYVSWWRDPAHVLNAHGGAIGVNANQSVNELWNGQSFVPLPSDGVALNDSNDVLCSGTYNAAIGHNDGACLLEGGSRQRYFLKTGTDAGMIPGDALQAQFGGIYPFALSNRLEVSGTSVQPVLNILFVAAVRRSAEANSWDSGTFLLRKLSNGNSVSFDVQEVVGLDAYFIKSINKNGVMSALGNLPGSGNDHALLLLPVEIGVDNNRDETLNLGSSGDQTTEQKPYRFWLNNDHDNYGDDTYDDQQDHPWTAQSLDSANTVIESQRDLEDFSRLHFRVDGIQQALASGSITLGLKWARSVSGTPGIRVFKAVESDGGTKYLSDAATAADQMSNGGSALGVVQGTAVLDLPSSFRTGATSSSTKYLLFEGLSEGKGELTLVFKQGGTVIGQGGSVFLHLLDIRKMYQRWRIAAAASFPDPDTASATTVSGVSSIADANGYPFQPAWDEDIQDKSYIVCVHGWRKNYNGARSDEITMFKRLWHRGFKGRYAGFYWPTLTGGPIAAKFNHSEYRAWKCGDAFKTFVESQLPSGYRTSVIAHSLGNVMVASALNKGLRFDKYALLNGAIPAQCFDPNPALKQTAATQTLPTGLWWPFNVTDYSAWAGGDLGDDLTAAIRSLSYRNRSASVGSTRLVNFFLSNDYATRGAWEANQWSAGDSVPGIDSKPIDGYDYDVGVRLHYDPIGPGDRAVTDAHEAMSMVNQSMTKAVGAEGRTRGSVTVAVDLATLVPAILEEHQAEFMFRAHRTWNVYGRLLEELGYLPTP